MINSIDTPPIVHPVRPAPATAPAPETTPAPDGVAPIPPEQNPFDGPTGTRSRSRRRLVPYASVGALLAAIVVAWMLTRSPDAPPGKTVAAGAAAAQPVMLTPEGARRIGVTYATASLQALTGSVRTVAQVTFDETRVKIIAPKIDGWVDRLYVNATGQYVAAGEPLLAIYSPMLVSAQQELLLAAQLGQEVAQGGDVARTGATDLRDAARRRLLYWDIGPAQIAELERTGAIQKTLVLRSPVSGFVVEKNVLGGQKTMAGEALYKIADLSAVWLEGEVFERDLARVRLGASVTMDFESLPDEHPVGRIGYIYPTLNAETRTARVRVVLSNPGMRFKPGMYATLHIASAPAAETVTVPRGAVLATGGRSLVFVRSKTGSLEPRPVTLGASTDDRTQILMGVTAGEVVVASATFLVDAESNLGSALGGMGNMPGMDAGTPAKAKAPSATTTPARP
jgi:Cu(I)/Ag(I) efflux system membrane fusion protein